MKLLIFTLVIALSFCGCAKSSDDNGSGGAVNESAASSLKKDAKSQKAYIIEDCLEDIGAAAAEIGSRRGSIEEWAWEEGPMYRYGDGEHWYIFSQYSIDDNGIYKPKGVCTNVIVPVSELISTPDGVYDIDALSEASGSKVSRGYNEINGVYYFETEYKDYKIIIYGGESGEISKESNADISKKQ